MILENFLIGVPVMLACLAIQAFVTAWCVRYYVRQVRRVPLDDRLHAGIRPLLIALVAMMLGTMVQVVSWGVLFLFLGEFSELYEAVYHSAVNFTSLGYGDVVMSKRWKLLGPLEAANGVLMFALTGAALMAILQQLVQAQLSKQRANP